MAVAEFSKYIVSNYDCDALDQIPGCTWEVVHFREGLSLVEQEHHEAEEKTLFPMLEKKIPGSMELNHKQHESFLQPVHPTFLTMVAVLTAFSWRSSSSTLSLPRRTSSTLPPSGRRYGIQPTPSRADSSLLRPTQIDEILFPVMEHLADELDSLDAEKVRLHRIYARKNL